jgi:DNA polymerase-3 subunit delta'
LLRASWERGRLAQALLLHGPSLPALEREAEGLAALIVEAGTNGVSHPDIVRVRPVNRMRQIGVDALRGLIRTVSHSGAAGGNKAVLLVEADRMNEAAANAFLKTLEEPPADTTLFLLTTRPHDLLPTIRSRCLSVSLPGESPPVQGGGWEEWRADFRGWLDRILTPPANREEVAETLLRLYGLVQRFQECLDRLAAERLAAESEPSANPPSDEEKAAFEAGVERGLRAELLAEVEEQLRRAALAEGGEPLEPNRIRKLDLAVREVERTAGLLALNLQATAAVESLLLKILRIWSRR